MIVGLLQSSAQKNELGGIAAGTGRLRGADRCVHGDSQSGKVPNHPVRHHRLLRKETSAAIAPSPRAPGEGIAAAKRTVT